MSHSTRSLTAGAIAMMAMTSCSLPPREAWRQIQTDGLIPFVAAQWTSESGPAAPASATQSKTQMVAQQTPKKQSPASSVSAPTTPTNAVASTTTATPSASTTPNNTPSPVMIDAKNLPKAQVVPGLAGYVRTPYTNPPRLVDVRGMSAGSKVVCPFTNKPFLVPAGVATEQPKVAAASAPTPTPAPTPQAPKVTPPASVPASVPTAPTKVAAMTKPQPTAPAQNTPAPQVKPQSQAPAPTKPAPIATTPPAKAETQEIPFGTPISGRPGFVNSPYAAKHQLVDVTGLPVGMEVKCPYTGKLFRVPPQADTQGKVPAQSTASPEKK